MVAQESKIFDLGTGIYTLPDVAAILGLPQAKVRRWLQEYWHAHFGKTDQISFSDGTGRELVTNFYTLIEFFTFYQLRAEGVSAQRIVKAHQVPAIPTLPFRTVLSQNNNTPRGCIRV